MTLAHTPAHHISYPDRFENEETGWGYSVLHDIDAEDPRSWTSNEDIAIHSIRVPARERLDEVPDNIASKAFDHFFRERSAQAALEMTRRYLTAFHPERHFELSTQTITGYCQSDWRELFIAVHRGHGEPGTHAETFRQWLFGDVWVVIPDGRPGTSGIYADDAEGALEYFRENFEDEPAHPQAAVHVWANTLPAAIASGLADREEPEAARAVAWLKMHENDSALWELLNHHLDTIQQMAATQTQE